MNKRKYFLVGIIVIAMLFSTAGTFGSIIVVNKNLIKNIIPQQSINEPILEVTTDKTAYKLGEPVNIFLTNVGDEILCGGGPIVTIYNNEDEIIYQEACYCYWELEQGEYITWPSWDQTDKQGNQVPIGEYTVEGILTGHDENYADTAIFFIIDYDPSGSPSGPKEGVVDEEYIFCIKLPVAPECGFHVILDWGDGTTSGWLGPYEAGEIICIAHSWAYPEYYDLRVKIRDCYGYEYLTDPWTIHIIINTPPIQPNIGGAKNGKVGTSYDYTFMSTDPEDSFIKYFIDWGDDTNTGWVGLCPSGQEQIFSHTYNEQETYTIKAKTKDIYDAESEWSEFEIKISNPRTRTSYYFKFIDMLGLLLKSVLLLKYEFCS